MLLCAQLFMEDMKTKEINFQMKEISEDELVIAVPFEGKLTQMFFSGPDGRYVAIYTVYESVPADKVTDLYVVCNQLNASYKWLKFFLDKDNDIVVQDDAIVSPESAAGECFELLLRRAVILKEVRPAIMRAIFM